MEAKPKKPPTLAEKTRGEIKEILDKGRNIFFTQEEIEKYIEEMTPVLEKVKKLKQEKKVRQNISQSDLLEYAIDNWKEYKAIHKALIDQETVPGGYKEASHWIAFYVHYDASAKRVEIVKSRRDAQKKDIKPLVNLSIEGVSMEKKFQFPEESLENEARWTNIEFSCYATDIANILECFNGANSDPLSTSRREELLLLRENFKDQITNYMKSISPDREVKQEESEQKAASESNHNLLLRSCEVKSINLMLKMDVFIDSGEEETSEQTLHNMVLCLKDCCRFYQKFCDNNVKEILTKFVIKVSEFYSFILFFHGTQKRAYKSAVTTCGRGNNCRICNSVKKQFKDRDQEEEQTFKLPKGDGKFCEIEHIIYLIQCDDERKSKYVGKTNRSLRERYPNIKTLPQDVRDCKSKTSYFILQHVDETVVFDDCGWLSLSRFIRTYPIHHLEEIEKMWINRVTQEGKDLNSHRRFSEHPPYHIERMKLFLMHCFTEEGTRELEEKELKPFIKRVILHD